MATAATKSRNSIFTILQETKYSISNFISYSYRGWNCTQVLNVSSTTSKETDYN